MIGGSMVREIGGSTFELPVVKLSAWLDVSREALESTDGRAAEWAMDQLRRHLATFLEEGWQFLDEATVTVEDDFLRNVMKYELTVRAVRRPGEWTSVDTQVLKDTGDAGL